MEVAQLLQEMKTGMINSVRLAGFMTANTVTQKNQECSSMRIAEHGRRFNRRGNNVQIPGRN
jgi:hypothetical protein